MPPLQAELETLLRLGVCIAVITSADFPAIDRQLSAAIQGTHKCHLHILTNRGSEVHGFDRQSRPTLLRRRSSATDEEERLLTDVAEACSTSDMKPIKEGLTDNSDPISWVGELAQRRHLPPEGILIVGGEFGSPGGIAGRDQQVRTPHSRGAVVVSVAPQPVEVPEGVIHLGGGRSRFQALLRAQIAAHRQLGQLPNTASPEATSLDLPASPTADPA